MPKTPSPLALLNGVDKTVIVTGKHLVSVIPQPSTGINVTPQSFGSRLTTLGTVYQEFRFRGITIKIHPPGTSATTSYIVSYFKTLPTTLPTSSNDFYQATASRLVANTDTVPQILVLRAPHLKNNVRPWFNCKETNDENLDYTQGAIYFYNTAGLTSTVPLIQVEIGYEIEFRGPTDPVAG